VYLLHADELNAVLPMMPAPCGFAEVQSDEHQTLCAHELPFDL